jgi:hypothetical protein
MKDIKLIIAGTRNCHLFKIDVNILNKIKDKYQISEVVSGHARGIDTLGERWAKKNNIKVTTFIPNWQDFGKAAGPIRNKEMASYGDVLIAFWDNESKGTKNMIDIMRRLQKEVIVIILQKEK